MTKITLRGVRKSYGRTPVVHGLDLDIASREFVVILGPSGCGKSTLLRMIAGLETITEGEISIDGAVVNKLEPRQRGCAMVFQNYALYPHMSVAENIGYALKVAGVPSAEREARVRKVASSVGLQELLERRPGQLSGGQRQRVAMARAMVREPKVFLFDEPFSNLDAKLRVAMRGEVRRLHRELGVTSVFVTHDQIEAMTLADRLIVMDAGVIEQVGSPAEVYNRPASRFVADFIGSPAMNLIDGDVTPDGYLVHGREGRIRVAGAAGELTERQVTVGIRPEHLRRVPAGGRDGIAGIVDYVEELGASRLVHAVADGIRLIAVDNADDHPVSGETVHFAFDPANVHVFSRADGRRLPAVGGTGSQAFAATA